MKSKIRRSQTKETKIASIKSANVISRLETSAKKYFYSLKIPKLVRIEYWFFDLIFPSHSNSGIFLTFIKLFFSTLHFPMSIFLYFINFHHQSPRFQPIKSFPKSEYKSQFPPQFPLYKCIHQRCENGYCHRDRALRKCRE